MLRHNSLLLFKANCLPEMKKDKVYIMKLGLNASSFDIIYAKCGCPAGKGPQGSCKHIVALSYALADYSRLRTLPEYVTYTEIAQQWNIPRKRRVEPIPVEVGVVSYSLQVYYEALGQRWLMTLAQSNTER